MARYKIKFGTSGWRALIAEDFNFENLRRVSLGSAKYLLSKSKNPKIIIGYDTRFMGLRFAQEVAKVMASEKITCCLTERDTPTPVMSAYIIKNKLAGGINITASHNPSQWNGLKFMDSNGRFLSPEDASQVFRLADQEDFSLKNWKYVGSEAIDNSANKRHIRAILKLPFINVSAIKRRKFAVAVDCVNGAGGLIVPQLLEKLGCMVIPINTDPNGKFAHTPEPLPENLGQLKKAVKESKADIGFAVDPDVDRCAIVDNKGKGLVAALNTGLEKCNSGLVARMDADDIMHSQRLRKQVDFLNSFL